MSDKGPTVFQALTDLYERIDAALAPNLAKQPITCRKGCAHCCLLFTAVSTADALRIAQQVLGWSDWREWVPKLVSAAQAHCFEGVNNTTYLDKKLRCVFLKDDNTCGIYKYRPAPCRFHLVVSPPEKCAPGAEPPTARLDLREAESHIWAFSAEVDQKLLKSETPILSPLPLMVLFGMSVLLDEKGPAAEFFVKATEGLPTPQEYFQKYIVPEFERRSVNGDA